MRSGPYGLLRELDRAALPDHRHLDLARILELALDLARDLVREQHRLVVVDLRGLHHDADLPARLQREHPLDSLLLGGDLLEVFETLDVVLEALAAGARARGRD